MPLNIKATNRYNHKKVMAYCCNRFMNPNIKIYFGLFGVIVNEDKYALGELVQWLYRGQIRTGKKIDAFIPASRMRVLLERYLNGKCI
jgi:hypothetical protein